MTSVCYFYKTTQDTAGPVPEGGIVRRWWWMEMGGLVWSIDGKSSKDKNQYLQGGWKFPQLPSPVVWRSLAAFLPCCFLLWVPFISCQNPSFTVLTPDSLSYRLKTEGIVKKWIPCDWEFGIHHMIVHLFHSLSCDLFYCTSLVPLCMWVSVCVCL